MLSDLGIARVTTYDALLEAQHIARQVRLTGCAPSRPRVCVVSTTGGGGAMVVDCLASRGAMLDPPSAATAAQLAALGIAAGHGALIDLTLAGATYRTIRAALAIVLAAPEYDAVVVVPGSSARFDPEVSVAPIVDLAGSAKPLAAFVFPSAPDALARLRESGVSALSAPPRRARTRSHRSSGACPPRPRRVPAIPAAPRRTVLDEDESYALLAGSGICGARHARSCGPAICLITFRWPARPR